MAPQNYDINTEDQLYSPAKVGDTVNPDLFKSPKTSFAQQPSKAARDASFGSFSKPESTVPFTQNITGSGSLAGQSPSPTMFGMSYSKTALDPRYILSESILGSIANLYEVSFSGFPIGIAKKEFVERELGLLCADASLPATSFGTLEVNGHYQGRTEVFAHTRIYPSLSLSFYETRDHKTLMFFEEWQRFVTVEGSPEASFDHFYRMRFPEEYKCDSIFITKFEKNYTGFGYADTLVYQFIRAFPSNVTSVPVSYGQSEFTKVTVEFAYDRYIVNPHKKKAEAKLGASSESIKKQLPREDLAIHALTNREMIESVGTPAQKRILIDADSNYPIGSSQREALRQAALAGTYTAPDAQGNIVRQSGRKVPANVIDKINKGFDAGLSTSQERLLSQVRSLSQTSSFDPRLSTSQVRQLSQTSSFGADPSTSQDARLSTSQVRPLSQTSSSAKVPADSIEKVSIEDNIGENINILPTINSTPPANTQSPKRTGNNSFSLGEGSTFEF